MEGIYINPYALYVWCDAGMDYDTENSGGVGFRIVFPEYINHEEIEKVIGRYVYANIERLELEAIIQGMKKVITLFEEGKLDGLKIIIFMTDRYGLNDKEKTSPYRIRQYRKDGWKNHEGKSIKNSDLLDSLDKTRMKIANLTHCSVEINYGRRKYNKVADKLAKMGKRHAIAKDDISLKGVKIGKRKFDGEEVDYRLLHEDTGHMVRVFKKEPVGDQWEIAIEICVGEYSGKKLKIYTDYKIERKLHRHHEYNIKIKKIFNHHVTIYRKFKEIKNK